MTPDLDATAATIAATQRPDGAIPADHRGELDPWNHVEAAMGLDTAGRHDAAAHAYHWLARHQNPDGSWYARYHDGHPTDLARDSNFTAYLAVGAHHHYLTTHDTAFLTELWPAIDRAITFVLGLQRTDGTIAWRRHPDDTTTDLALLTGNCSIHHALRCARTLATHLGQHRPRWTAAATRLHTAILTPTDRFAPKPHAMDWYYPVLGGALDPTAAQHHLDQQWNRFVHPTHGVRCVHHEPWTTAAETAELALTLATLGQHTPAHRLLHALQRLRHHDGSYWTGHNYTTNTHWPPERTTWTAAAVLLANAALNGHRPTLQTFGPDTG